MLDKIHIEGARTHNLKNFNLDIPKNKLVVITGLSGSGKSSLAFDTIYAEGHRRYVESLSAYARQFLQMMDKPDVDSIEGLSPSISIEQKSTSHNPRSTVGTVTEIYDYLRLLYARVGTPYCPTHNMPLASQTISQMVDYVLSLEEGTKIMIMSPLVVNRKGEFLDLFEEFKSKGFNKVEVDGEMYELQEVPALNKKVNHTIYLVVDRLKVRESAKQRLAESFELAVRHGMDRCVAKEMDTGVVHHFSARYSCPECNFSLSELEPRLFSFNNPLGACPTCDGLGFTSVVDESKLLGDPDLSLMEGAITVINGSRNWDRCRLESLGRHYDFDPFTPWNELPPKIHNVIMNGSGDEKITFRWEKKGHRTEETKVYMGVKKWIQTLFLERIPLRFTGIDPEKFISSTTCPDCGGRRLNPEARNVRVGGATLPEICEKPLDDLIKKVEGLDLKGNQEFIARKILKEIRERLHFLINVGLNYLNLGRSAETLSGGEAQRIRLASQIGSGLTGVMYVLDEPSIGLHQRDNSRLIGTLKHLRDLGNTVIVVEHDEEAITSADYVVDIGPGAGEFGGEIIVAGTPDDVKKCPKSLTGQYLSGKKEIPVPKTRVDVSKAKWLTIRGCTGNNLKNVDVSIPVGTVTCVTGVSGSGKSTLINDTLGTVCQNELNGARRDTAPYASIEGLENFSKFIDVDQSPIGRTPRSNPATYTNLFTPIRDLFSQVPLARQRGYTPGRFSFNVKGGRCEACKGDGLVKVEMHFLSDVYVKCEVCDGKRYNRETLEILYKGKNISDVLDMTVAEALEFFDAVPAIRSRLETLKDVGLGYIRLGQSSTTLSGGEAQRVKLALELAKKDTGDTLYILDEPTTGLHFEDIYQLLDVIARLKEKGNTIIIIEHNLDVIKTADWIVDLGPEGGDGGGTVIARGSPEAIALTKGSHTGEYLLPLLEKGAKENLEAMRKIMDKGGPKIDVPSDKPVKARKSTAKAGAAKPATKSKAKARKVQSDANEMPDMELDDDFDMMDMEKRIEEGVDLDEIREPEIKPKNLKVRDVTKSGISEARKAAKDAMEGSDDASAASTPKKKPGRIRKKSGE